MLAGLEYYPDGISPPSLPKVHTALLIIQLATAVELGITHAITGLQQSSTATKQGPVAAHTMRGALRVHTLEPAHTHTLRLVSLFWATHYSWRTLSCYAQGSVRANPPIEDGEYV